MLVTLNCRPIAADLNASALPAASVVDMKITGAGGGEEAEKEREEDVVARGCAWV
jgi:hypothetical protein